jgi:hypothetical protein
MNVPRSWLSSHAVVTSYRHDASLFACLAPKERLHYRCPISTKGAQ